jgi:hypothetical protein
MFKNNKNSRISQSNSDQVISSRNNLRDDGKPGRGPDVETREGGSTRVRPLSNPHISPLGAERGRKSAIAEFYANGRLLTLKKPKIEEAAEDHICGKRGNVVVFSRASRLRLMKQLGMIDETGAKPYFLTLTYPDSYTHELREVKRHLDNFWKRVARKFPKFGVIWKLEFQKRGAAHFHCLIWGLPAVPYHELARWFAENWYQVVGSGDPLHLAWHLGELGNTPCLQFVRSWRGVWAYASKYLAKTDLAKSENPGRFWGVRGVLPTGQVVSVSLTYREVCQFMRFLRRACHLRARDYRSLSGFVNCNFWLSKIVPYFCTERSA